jgi:hypothetical protein
MLDTQSHVMRFVEADLTQPLPVQATYGYCTDVLEHIAPENVDAVIDNCLLSCRHVFFQISTVDDAMGALIGMPLHLTVQPYEWWLNKFRERNCIIHWSKEDPQSCMFYVSTWISIGDVDVAGQLNTEIEQIKEQVKHNIFAWVPTGCPASNQRCGGDDCGRWAFPG